MLKRISFIFIFLFIGFFAISQEDQPRTVSEIMQDIKSQVSELESLSDARLQIIENDKASIEKLSNENASIQASLTELLSELSEANETIIRQDVKIKSQRNLLLIISSILFFFFVLHLVIIFLKYKFNITLPYFLNSLL